LSLPLKVVTPCPFRTFRVAVAIANNPSRTFAGDASAIAQAQNLANGNIIADHNQYPAIMLNGVQDVQDLDRLIAGTESTAQSQTFTITYNRKTNHAHSPFRFEWEPDTPAGARLVVDGAVIATAPDNPDRTFYGDITSFQIEMPNEEQFAGQEAKVNGTAPRELDNPFAPPCFTPCQ